MKIIQNLLKVLELIYQNGLVLWSFLTTYIMPMTKRNIHTVVFVFNSSQGTPCINPLMADDPSWKMAFDERHPSMELELWSNYLFHCIDSKNKSWAHRMHQYIQRIGSFSHDWFLNYQTSILFALSVVLCILYLVTHWISG